LYLAAATFIALFESMSDFKEVRTGFHGKMSCILTVITGGFGSTTARERGIDAGTHNVLHSLETMFISITAGPSHP
jgi:hypothetical protein